MSRPPNRDSLPPIRDIAETLQNGWDFDELCERYDISAGALTHRLSIAGYATSGHPKRTEARAVSLVASAEGNCVTGNGGGDYTGLPLEPVPHRVRSRRVFVGLDWSTSPASGPQWVEL